MKIKIRCGKCGSKINTTDYAIDNDGNLKMFVAPCPKCPEGVKEYETSADNKPAQEDIGYHNEPKYDPDFRPVEQIQFQVALERAKLRREAKRAMAQEERLSGIPRTAPLDEPPMPGDEYDGHPEDQIKGSA